MFARQSIMGLLVLGLVFQAGQVRAAESDKYLPNGSDSVVAINVKQLLAAPALKIGLEEFKKQLAGSDEAQQALKALGFDPLKDIERIVAGGSGQNPDEVLMVIQGKFDVDKFAALAEQAAQGGQVKIVKKGGYTLYEATPPQAQGQTVTLAFIDGTAIVAAANQSLVLDALDKKAGKKKAELKKELIDQLAKVNANQSVSVIMLESALANAPVPALMKLTSITGGLTLTDELKAEFNLNTKNADDAKTIGEEARDGLNQAKAIVALMAAQQKQLAPLADILTSVKVNTKGNSISVIGGVSKQQLDELMKQIPKR